MAMSTVLPKIPCSYVNGVVVQQAKTNILEHEWINEIVIAVENKCYTFFYFVGVRTVVS